MAGSKQIPDLYVDALCREIIFRNGEKLDENWKSVYIGGGTPSLLNDRQLEKIMSAVKKCRKIALETEVTIELNPDDITEQLLQILEKNGINRISVGIQSLNEKALEFSGRRASLNQNVSALECISKNWRHRFSADLICGLPYETEASFLHGMEKLLSYRPDHISMYSLTFEDETPFGKLLESGKLEYDFDFSDDLWLKGRQFLFKNGFSQYEVSNFSLNHCESIHNLTYWQHASYCGAGSGGAGTVYNGDGSGFRWSNTIDIKKYSDFWNKVSEIDDKNLPCECEEIDIQTSKYEFFMMGLRALNGVKEKDYYRIFNEPFPESFVKLARQWQKDGLCIVSGTAGDFSISLGTEGILFLNKFLQQLEI